MSNRAALRHYATTHASDPSRGAAPLGGMGRPEPSRAEPEIERFPVGSRGPHSLSHAFVSDLMLNSSGLCQQTRTICAKYPMNPDLGILLKRNAY